MSSKFEFFDEPNPQMQETHLINQYLKSVHIATKVLEEKCRQFIRFPKSHPLYTDFWGEFWSKHYKKLTNKGKNSNTCDYNNEWENFWESRMIMICVQQKLLKMNEIRQQMNLSEEFVSMINLRPRLKHKRGNRSSKKKVAQSNSPMQHQSNFQCLPTELSQPQCEILEDSKNNFEEKAKSENIFSLNSNSETLAKSDSKKCQKFTLRPSRLSTTPSCTTNSKSNVPLFFIRPSKSPIIISDDDEVKPGFDKLKCEDIETLTDDDLKILLENFLELTCKEQDDLIQYLKDIKSVDEDRIKRLRKFLTHMIYEIKEEEFPIGIFKSETECSKILLDDKFNIIKEVKPISVVLNPAAVSTKQKITSIEKSQQSLFNSNDINHLQNPRLIQQPFYDQPIAQSLHEKPSSLKRSNEFSLNKMKFKKKIQASVSYKNLDRPNIIQLTGRKFSNNHKI